MKKVKIRQISCEMFKALRKLNIKLDGNNATISGENGAGKTSIVDLYVWLMTGKFSDGRVGEIANFNEGSDANIIGEISFSNGVILRRETNGSAKFFVNGVPVKMMEYFSAANSIANGAPANVIPTLIMPQNFFRLSIAGRREVLMPLVNITNDSVIASDERLADLADMLKKLTPEQIDRQARAKRRKLDSERDGIPARIDELTKQIEDIPDKAELAVKVAELQAQFDSMSKEISELQAEAAQKLKPRDKLGALRKSIYEIEKGITQAKSQIEINEAKLEIQREVYKRMKNAMRGKCPTCGAAVTNEKAAELKAQLARIEAECQPITEEQKTLKRGIDAAQAKHDELKAQADELEATLDNESEKSILDKIIEKTRERNEIQKQLSEATYQLYDAKKAEETLNRIENLRRREAELGNKISELDQHIFLAGLFVSQKIKLIEDAINSQFGIVKFKMFDEFKTVEGVKETCEPMIDGVPFNSLSKGERLKASLDILRTFQKFYDVELPVFIDDAESYTSNSLVDLPNQIIRLKATEGVKKLNVDIEQNYGQMELNFGLGETA